MQLGNLKPKVKNKKSKRLGRGIGCGRGKTSGRGHKGTGQRAGRRFYVGFEGGIVNIIRRLPKRGFNHKPKHEFQIVNTGDLDKHFDDKAVIKIKDLKEKGLIRKEKLPVKVLGKGDITKTFSVFAHKFSNSAKEKIEAKKGKIKCLSL